MDQQELYLALMASVRELEDRLVWRIRTLEDDLTCLTGRVTTDDSAREDCEAIGFNFEAGEELDEDASEY